MTHVKFFLAGLLAIGLAFLPAIAAAQEAPSSITPSRSVVAAYGVTIRHHVEALNAVAIKRKVSVVQASKATASAESFYATYRAEGHMVVLQANVTKELEHGMQPVNTVALEELYRKMVLAGVNPAGLTSRGFVGGMTRLHQLALPEDVDALKAPGGVERAVERLQLAANQNLVSLQNMSFPVGKLKGHVESVAIWSGCGGLDAGLGLLGSIVAGLEKAGAVSGGFSVLFAIQLAFAAILCELDCPECDGVNFDSCPECTAELRVPAMRKEGY